MNKPIKKVINFYTAFLKDNNFSIIGGEEGPKFNASVKKGRTMFTLKISSDKNYTVVQFIW